MVQSLAGFGLKGGGIVAVLFIMGFILSQSKLDVGLGSFAIGAAVFIAIVFGLLGGIGIVKRLIG